MMYHVTINKDEDWEKVPVGAQFRTMVAPPMNQIDRVSFTGVHAGPGRFIRGEDHIRSLGDTVGLAPDIGGFRVILPANTRLPLIESSKIGSILNILEAGDE
jgi:hypothetical protein